MVRGPSFQHHILEFVLDYYLPVTNQEWENFVGPLYCRLSLKSNEWYNIQRHWKETLQHSTDEWVLRLREIIALKAAGLPYTNPFTGIRYNNDNNNAATNATEAANAVAASNEQILELQETIQELEMTIERLQQQLAKSNGDADIPTDGVPNNFSKTRIVTRFPVKHQILVHGYVGICRTTPTTMAAIAY